MARPLAAMETKGRPKVASLKEVLMHACSGMQQAHLEIKGGKQEEAEEGGPMGPMHAAHSNPRRPALFHVLLLEIQ